MNKRSGYYRFPTIHDTNVVFVCEDDLWSVSLKGGYTVRLTSNLGAVFELFRAVQGNFYLDIVSALSEIFGAR